MVSIASNRRPKCSLLRIWWRRIGQELRQASESAFQTACFQVLFVNCFPSSNFEIFEVVSLVASMIIVPFSRLIAGLANSIP
jgi:hypothetical protein